MEVKKEKNKKDLEQAETDKEPRETRGGMKGWSVNTNREVDGEIDLCTGVNRWPSDGHMETLKDKETK